MKIIADANIPYVEDAFSSLGQVSTCEGRHLVAAQVADADILLVRSVTKVNELLLGNSKVKYVGSATIGTDHIDTGFLEKRAIPFVSAPGSNATSAAEYVVTALLVTADRNGFDLKDKRVGIVGCGNVGSRVLQRLQALGVECIVNDPPRQARYNDLSYVSFDDILGADIITAHIPLDMQGPNRTYHLFDRQFFAGLKPNAIFVNTSRGAVVDQSGLQHALNFRDDISLVLDVWENEPDIDSKLVERVGIATPHIAGYSLDGKIRGTEMIYASACQFFNRPKKWTVNYALLPDPQIVDLTASINPIKDDNALREVMNMAQPDRAVHFDRLRKFYPPRREFAFHQVLLNKSQGSLADKLTALGFKVAFSSS